MAAIPKKWLGRKRISEKIAKLMREGDSPKQAAAVAYSMERSGRLGRHGKYRRVGRKSRRRRSGRRQ